MIDSRGVVASRVELKIGREESNESFGWHPVHLDADGSFVAGPLVPATYVLEVRPSTHEPGTKAEGGLDVVTVGSSDVDGVVLRTRPGFSVTGRFLMESDNPSAAWPPHIVVQALLALDGSGMVPSSVAEGAPAGTFVFRNVYGPRVIRCGYTLAAGSRWWPDRVLLDGLDITDVPTELSGAQQGRLEVVFTQHPARFMGSVKDSRGQPVRQAWVVVFSADPMRWQRWSAAAKAIRADFKGVFDFTSLPGAYLVRAFSPEAFRTQRHALRDFERLSQGAIRTELKHRERKVLALSIESR